MVMISRSVQKFLQAESVALACASGRDNHKFEDFQIKIFRGFLVSQGCSSVHLLRPAGLVLIKLVH